ncbi:MAG: tetratricopeptide repeat protein, partial [Bacteroidota bacterium]
MRALTTIVLLVLLGMPFRSAADDVRGHYEERVTEANAAYKTNDYETALTIYQEVEAAGYRSATLFFNMGNTHFKLNDKASAILYYERARRLDPGDTDIRFNLDLVNATIVDKTEALPELFYHRWWASFRSLGSVDGWGILSLITALLAFGALALFAASRTDMARKLAFAGSLFCFLLTALCYTCAALNKQALTTQQEAIVFSPSLTGTSEPGVNGKQLFIVHEGTKVTLLEQDGEWQRIALGNGSIGWVPASSLAGICQCRGLYRGADGSGCRNEGA